MVRIDPAIMEKRSMARKKRKSPTAGRKKKSKAAKRKGRAAKPRRRAKRTLRNRVTGAYRAVVGTIKDTDRLRNRLEPPATSETE